MAARFKRELDERGRVVRRKRPACTHPVSSIVSTTFGEPRWCKDCGEPSAVTDDELLDHAIQQLGDVFARLPQHLQHRLFVRLNGRVARGWF